MSNPDSSPKSMVSMRSFILVLEKEAKPNFHSPNFSPDHPRPHLDWTQIQSQTFSPDNIPPFSHLIWQEIPAASSLSRITNSLRVETKKVTLRLCSTRPRVCPRKYPQFRLLHLDDWLIFPVIAFPSSEWSLEHNWCFLERDPKISFI